MTSHHYASLQHRDRESSRGAVTAQNPAIVIAITSEIAKVIAITTEIAGGIARGTRAAVSAVVVSGGHPGLSVCDDVRDFSQFL